MTRTRRLAAALAVAAGLLGGCGDDGGGGGGAGAGAGTTSAAEALEDRIERYRVESRAHVPGRVDYPQTPPVGGPHNAVWQNCGFYSEPVVSELAVHSLEHGAVWITYRPGLPSEQVDALRQLARAENYVLVSPWPDASLPAPVVASAWGVQLTAESATDPAVRAFVEEYAGGDQAPEPGAACTGGFGTPA